jgi:nucleoside-diphosphate-sugar epimerase
MAKPRGVEGLKCFVTGGSGFVGQRLCEMLLDRGAASVVSFDVAGPPRWARVDPRLRYVQGDIADYDQVVAAMGTGGLDCVWHVAALVGPFHPKPRYMAVNFEGSKNVLRACQATGCRRLVMSSSPSTRFDGTDIVGLREDQLAYPKVFLQDYAESKALGEQAIRTACNEAEDFLTVAVAPHQVYGPRDSLFFPNLLSASSSGKLRIFGDGENEVSFTHVDNYCHGLILGYHALYKGSPALGQFYIVTDGGRQKFWRVVDDGCVQLGCRSVFTKLKLPFTLMLAVSYLCNVVGLLLGRKLKLTPFTVRMLTIHRWFDISNARRDLGYEPVISFEDGWRQTIDWFKANPQFWRDSAADTGRRSEAKKFA